MFLCVYECSGLSDNYLYVAMLENKPCLIEVLKYKYEQIK